MKGIHFKTSVFHFNSTSDSNELVIKNYVGMETSRNLLPWLLFTVFKSFPIRYLHTCKIHSQSKTEHTKFINPLKDGLFFIFGYDK